MTLSETPDPPRSSENSPPWAHVVPVGYELLALVNDTGRARLFRGRRASDGASVLVKTPAEVSNGRLEEAAFRREYDLGRRIRSPNVARYAEVVVSEDGVALILDDVDGEPLNRIIPPAGFGTRRWVDLALGLANGIEALHAARVVHRDVRPAAVLANPASGAVTFVDLGLARPTAGSAALDAGAPAVGAAAYMSPEQTGRTGRSVDQRSDLYSLGVTLFELACGQRPFAAADVLELVHAHIARRAPSPRELNPSVPKIVSSIISKLLEKSPDERYQSAGGLKADLEKLREALDRGDGDVEFTLGSSDVSEHLRLPSRLYGREAELERMHAAFDRVAAGTKQVISVAGATGVGKTSLVGEIRTRALERQGYFVSGKFEQLGGSVPYGPLKQAMGELLRQLLSETDARIEHWRRELGQRLGEQARVLADLFPELSKILPEQAAVEPLGPVDAENRFTRLFCRLVSAFARKQHPLVVFIDDWQWADSGTLKLLHAAALDPDIEALLLIGAYRDNEVDGMHPAMTTLERIGKAGVPVTTVSLKPLTHDALIQMLFDGLRCPLDHAAALAPVIWQRTSGNPFFVRALLQVLQETGGLTFQRELGWRANLETLGAPSEASVLDLVVTRIERLPARTCELLEIAACLGSELTLAELAAAAGVTEPEAAEALEPALEAHLVINQRSSLRFLHDRVQEAAYSLIPAAERPRRQLQIGYRLLAAERGSDELARATDHLNAGRSALGADSERLVLAQLNLRVGRLARHSTAYAAAAAYAATGMELLPERAWHEQYDLTLDLYLLRAESEYLSGNFETAEQIYPAALSGARETLDRIRLLTIQKDQYELQGRYPEAIAILRQALSLLGVDLPESEQDLRDLLDEELRLVPRNLGDRSIASLRDRPEITDPELIAQLNLFMGMWPSCYVAGLQTLLAVVSVKIANFCLVHGNCEVTPAAFVNYSFVAGYVTGDYRTAYEFGQLGMELADRYPNRSVRSWCYFLFGCGTALWQRALRDSNSILERSFELGVESGNLASASYACSYVVTDRYFQGAQLSEVDELYTKYSDFLRRNNPAIHLFLELGIRSMRRLIGRDGFDERAFLQQFASNVFFMAVYRSGRLPAMYLLGEREGAVALADEALASARQLLAGTWKVVEVTTFAALTYLREWAHAAPEERTRFAAAVTEAIDELRTLCNHYAPNVEHKLLLVEAERARTEGRFEEAVQLYERAAASAARDGFRQYEALANELAGRFWAERGITRIASLYLNQAHVQYARWGATEKLAAFEKEFGALLSTRRSGPRSHAANAEHVKALGNQPLDLLSMAKAWQAISSEIERERLIAKLMRIIVENAGAQRGTLLLKSDGALGVVATAHNGGERIDTSPPTDSGEFVESIVRYAARSGETVVLHNAAEQGLFVGDPQVRARRPRSVLCAPIRIQDETVGVVYLENELDDGAFTPDRAFVVELLAGQAAVSLENARLYGDLRELMANVEAARREAETANRAKDEFLAMLGHELRNPLAPILTALQLMQLRGGNFLDRERAIIERQARHMVRLVDDLLDVSRITRGKIELDDAPVELAEVLARALEMSSPLLDRREHELTVDVEPGLVLRGDAARLAQVFSNLLTNAAKYTPSRGRIAVRAARERGGIRVSVKDNGAGIKPEMLPQVFDLFVQERQAIDRSAGGLGLGLAIVRSLVTLHGGTVEAHSAGPKQGSEFVVWLPPTATLPASDVAASPRALPPLTSGPVRRVLVVDDNEDAAATMAEALRDAGHEVRVAYDAAAALACLDTYVPDFALLDIGLPVMDGYELARHIRRDPRLASMKLMAVTGYGQRSDQSRALETGFDVHLVKPVDLQAVIALIAK